MYFLKFIGSLIANLGKFLVPGQERPSPSDIVPRCNIVVGGDEVTINLYNLNIPLAHTPRVWVPMIPDTNSMDGAFDFGNNNILIAGATSPDHKALVEYLSVGDIAVYNNDKIYAIHRIVKIGHDEEGKFFKFKGDNNPTNDPWVVRPNHVQWVSIGTIY